MGKLGILRTIGLIVAVALIALGVVGLAQILSGPTQRDLGPGIVVDQQFAPPQEDPTTGVTGSPAPSTTPEESDSTTPQQSETTDPGTTNSGTPASTAPESTRSQGPVNPLPPKSPRVYVDDDDDDDDWDDDDDDWDDDDDDDDD